MELELSIDGRILLERPHDVFAVRMGFRGNLEPKNDGPLVDFRILREPRAVPHLDHRLFGPQRLDRHRRLP